MEHEDGEGPPEKLIQAGRLLAVGEVRPAITILTDLLEEMPDQIDALNWMGAIRGIEGRNEEALAYLDRAAAVAPYHSGVLTNRGNILMDMDDFPGAVTAYRDAVKFDEKAYGAMNNLGALLRAYKMPEDAERMLLLAIEGLPKYGLAHYNLSALYGGIGRYDDAVKHAQLAVEYMPSGTVSIQVLASAYIRNNDRPAAIGVVKRWIEAHPEDPEASHILATVEGNSPERATDSYIETLFNRFANSFDAKLAKLEYRAPEIIGEMLDRFAGPKSGTLRILDAGCGTGLCAVYARDYAAHLAGADLSVGMLQRAGRTGLYDQLIKGELTEFLHRAPEPYDIVLSADTLCYFGALEGFASGAAKAIVPGGLLTFTVEAGGKDVSSYRLELNGRYQHARSYVLAAVETAGFEILHIADEKLRMESGEPVIGHVVVARRL